MKPNNPEAFPGKRTPFSSVDGSEHFVGMTLLDYFAAKAMQGNLASLNPGFINSGDGACEYAAEGYYAMAKAMLAEREKHI